MRLPRPLDADEVRVLGALLEKEQLTPDLYPLTLPALLLLRGPQTAAELRARAERMHAFPSVAAAEELLRGMAAHPEPLVVELPRRPGQKEARWAHLVSGAPEVAGAVRPLPPAGPSAIEGRLLALEERLAAVEAELAALKGSLGV